MITLDSMPYAKQATLIKLLDDLDSTVSSPRYSEGMTRDSVALMLNDIRRVVNDDGIDFVRCPVPASNGSGGGAAGSPGRR